MHLFLKANHYSRKDNRCVFQFVRVQFQCYILHAEYCNTDNKRRHKGAQKTLLHPDGSIADSCGGFNTRCIIAKGIKSDCNHLMRTTPRRSASGCCFPFREMTYSVSFSAIFSTIFFWQPIASIVIILPFKSNRSRSSGMAVISFDFSSVFTCPKHTPRECALS